MKQMRATKKRTTAIVQAMEDNDSITMLQAAQRIGVPGDIAAEWYQNGVNYSPSEVCREFHWAVQKLLMDRERREMDRQVLQTAIAQAQAGNKQIQRILKRKGINYSQ